MIYAQMLNTKVSLFAEMPFFNEQFIKDKSIKTLAGEFHYKRDGEKMYEKGMMVYYDFNPKGQLARQYTVFRKPGGGSDTTFFYYEYDEKNRLKIKRSSDNFGFYSFTYEYDQNNNVIKEIYSRELNENGFSGNFILAKQYPLGVENYQYQYFTPLQFKKKHLNNLGSVFKEVIIEKDEKGNIIEENGRFVNTSAMETKTNVYSSIGFLIETNETNEVAGRSNVVHFFKYDDKNNVEEIKKTRNGTVQSNTEFMYSPEGILTAKLTRDENTKTIEVIKFTCWYY
jgi:hypothetical protein